MAKQTIGIGSSANDGTGDTLRDGAIKANANFTEIYDKLGDSTNVLIDIVNFCVIAGPIGQTPATNSPLTTEIATLTVTGVGGGTAEDFSSTNVKLDSTQVSFDAT